jgi:hypothetical protein
MATSLEVLNAAQIAVLGNKPSALMYQETSQTIGPSYTLMTYQVAVGDIWGGWSSGSPGIYTVPVAGTYRVAYSVAWTTASGQVLAYVQHNGTQILASKTEHNAEATSFGITGPEILQSCAVGDTFGVQIYSTVSSHSTLVADPFNSSMLVEFLHF